jgi:fructose-1,6-bisphosphatase/inositol monophosphatase family enzyme
MTRLKLGAVNGHIIGHVLKEAVRRAVVTIRSERAIFESTVKESYGGTMDDVFTSADTKAQDIYARVFKECFPGCGVIGEESLSILPRKGYTAYFTVDPLDGTKAFVRRQSHGVSSMVALVDGGEVISAYIGDVNTEEMFGYRPGSDNVHRITRLDTFERLGPGEPIAADNFFGLLREPLDKYSDVTQIFFSRLKNYEVMGSSIGTWTARLWKREVSLVVLPPGHETPWDSTPVIGISQKLGYVFLRPSLRTRSGWEEYTPVLPKTVIKRTHDMMIILRRDAETLNLI